MNKKDHLLLVAAGKGQRFGGPLPKQYCLVGGRTIMEWTLDIWQQVAINGQRWLILAEGDQEGVRLAQSYEGVETLIGGAERAQSVLAGLMKLDAASDDWVLVHDIVRPCVRLQDIHALRQQGNRTQKGALLATPVTDTIKELQGETLSTLDRTHLWAAQTPQYFPVSLLKRALSQASASVTDEAMAMEQAGFPVDLVAGEMDNIKLTHASDVALVECCLKRQGRLPV